MKKLFVMPLLAMAVVGLAQAQQGKVAIMNIQGAISATKDGQKAASDLESKFGPKKKEVDSRQAEITSLKDQLQKGQNTMSETAKAELARNIDVKTKSLNRQMEDAQAEMQSDEQKALQGIFQKMQVVIDKYAKENGFSLILDVSSQQTPVLYASNTIDVTKEIIDLYDKNTGSAAASPAPPTAPKPGTPAKP
jgi:outer membrane protein